MKISYGLTAWIEHEELNNLLNYLKENIDDRDEIIVVYDQNRATPEVLSVLESFDRHDYFYYPFNFQQDWLANKNYLGTKCSGDYIFQIDADEIPNKELLETLPFLLEMNKDVDVMLVPRVNTIKGLTQDHIAKWRWSVNEKEWVNWPDYQWRIYKNDPTIKWVNKVHEKLDGFKKYATLPMEEEFALYHPKDIKRQEKQNAYYDTL